MLFRGRTVAIMLLITLFASVLVTLTIADRILLEFDANAPAASASGEPGGDSAGMSAGEAGKLNAVLKLIEERYYREIDRGSLIDGAIRGMIATLDDPYSLYMQKEEAEAFSDSVEGTFSGIGARLQVRGGKVIVESAIKGSPAERAGLHPKDVLLSVNGESLEGIDLQQAVGLIRGPKGTKARLLVQREGVSEPIQLILVRDDIEYESVAARMTEDGYGIIEIRQFAMNSLERFEEELAALEAQGMKGLILDVRNNPGGPLPVVASIAQLFIEQGKPIVQVEERDGKREQTLSKGTRKPYPLAVLVNRGSASASEVLAAALRESAGVPIIGETTFGKGTVQVSYDKAIGDGSQIKMTIAKWLTPSGNWVNEKGIEPDLLVGQPDYFRVARLSRTQTLQTEMVAEDVRSLQIMLDGLGYAPDRKDGYFSEGTEAALRAFQAEAGLQVTGRLNSATADELEERTRDLIRDPANDAQLNRTLAYLRAVNGIAGGTAGSVPEEENAAEPTT